jgi:hypothetical protein
MREIRPSGSEGGAGSIPVPTPIEDAPASGRSKETAARERVADQDAPVSGRPTKTGARAGGRSRRASKLAAYETRARAGGRRDAPVSERPTKTRR